MTAVDYWITGARIVDGTGAEAVTGRSIRISHGSIVEIGDAPSDTAAPERIDASGLTITPGLIDAHAHFGLSSDITASLRRELSVAELAADMFANCAATLDAGFTTARDPGGSDGGLVRAVESGRVRGPRILTAGPIQCQTGGHGHLGSDWEPTADWSDHDIPGLRSLSLLSDGPDEMRKNVREAFRRGASFIKLCVTGGVVSTHDKLTDTQFTVPEIAAAVEEAESRGTYVTVHAHNNAGIRNAIHAGVRCVEHGSDIDEDTAALMAEHGVALVPTLSVVYALLEDASEAGLPPEIADRVGPALDGQIAGLKAARAAGVKVGSGSDLIGPRFTRRGRELSYRSAVETPMLALESATRINAEILGIGEETGTIEIGKLADLVAWRSDPLADPEVFGDPGNAVLVVKAGELVKDLR